jgi:hypothetical protein
VDTAVIGDFCGARSKRDIQIGAQKNFFATQVGVFDLGQICFQRTRQ